MPKMIVGMWWSTHIIFNLTIRASLAPRYNTIFTQSQKVKYTNPNDHKTVQKLQELEESARELESALLGLIFIYIFFKLTIKKIFPS